MVLVRLQINSQNMKFALAPAHFDQTLPSSLTNGANFFPEDFAITRQIDLLRVNRRFQQHHLLIANIVHKARHWDLIFTCFDFDSGRLDLVGSFADVHLHTLVSGVLPLNTLLTKLPCQKVRGIVLARASLLRVSFRPDRS